MSFQLLELLGEGSQGQVYKALRQDRSSGLKQHVAVKILHSRTAVDMWRQEFESLHRVRSSFCVQVLSFERIRRKPALVLEYVDGVTLAQLGRSCWLDKVDLDEILAQIEHGLKDLHRQNVLHGDLSPQNVLLDSQGRVRLLDFGLANSEGRRLTPQFASPERLNGEPPSEKSDLYSLGKLERYLSPDSQSSPSWLAEDPSERRYQDLSLSVERQNRLAEKIRLLLERRRTRASVTTESHTTLGPIKQKKLLAGIMATLLVLIPAASHSLFTAQLGTLSVRTRHWHLLLLNDKPLGYTPVNILVNANQKLKLRWSSAVGRGERTIQLRPLETLRLEDSDFSH